MDEKRLKAIKNELVKRIDKKSKVQAEKVDRYMNLVELYYQLDDAINDLGIMIKTVNGAQEFTKPNPAIAEKNKINSSLIALGKDLGLDESVKPADIDDSKSDLI